MSQSETFSIRQMVELTGLSEFTIRGWENRYAAFSPKRTETGRREYPKSDVERAILLRELLKRGHKIGKIAKLPNPSLRKTFENLDSTQAHPSVANDNDTVTRVMELLSLQRWSDLKEAIDAIPTKNPSKMIREFFLPLLQALAANVSAGLVSIAQEHVLSAILKEKIHAALIAVEKKNRVRHDRSSFVLAAPEGDHHEMGLLLAHLLIRAHGFDSLYLGPHTPARDLAETALRTGASHIVSVLTVSKRSGARQEPLTYINDLQRQVGAHLRIWVAGNQAPVLDGPNFSLLPNFIQLETNLLQLGGRL